MLNLPHRSLQWPELMPATFQQLNSATCLIVWKKAKHGSDKSPIERSLEGAIICFQLSFWMPRSTKARERISST